MNVAGTRRSAGTPVGAGQSVRSRPPFEAVPPVESAPVTAGWSARARRAALIVVLGWAAVTWSACVDIVGAGHRDIEIIWPRRDAVLYDYEVLRARVRGHDLDDYDIYWYVDDSRERRMWNEWYGRPDHKAYEVDTYYWNWRGRGPYTVGFIAEDRHGREIAHRTVRVYVR